MKKNTLGRIGKTMGAVFLVAALLLTSGCSFALPEQLLNLLQPTEATAPTGGKLPVPTATTPSNDPIPGGDADASLVSLRQAMVGTSQLFAVAYFGYHDNWEDATWVETHTNAIAQQIARGLSEYFGLPFIYPMDPVDGEVDVDYGTLDLRSAPSPDGTVLANMADGAQVRVFGEWQGWYVVHYLNYVGYAAAAYIDI
jgi:hypothetical protein